MSISSINLSNSHPLISPSVASSEASSKNLQSQLAMKEQSLNRLSSDSELSAEEKEKKRLEIQKEIDELNRKLKLSQMKQKDESAEAAKKQEQETAAKEALAETKNSQADENDDSATLQASENKPTELPLQDILALNNRHQKELVLKTADTQKESTINVLESEIKLDEMYGSDTTAKEEKVAEIREKENFWLDAQKQEQEDAEQKMQAAMNVHAKIIIS